MTNEANGRAPLDSVRIATGDSPFFVEIVPETPSTNALLATRAREGAREGLVIATERQTAGRGRLDRTWQTPPLHAALTFSVLLRPPALLPAPRWPWLPLLTGLAVSSALREQGYAAGVKWPNDVLIAGPAGERKVCGILVERIETPDGPAAIVGIGLNTSLTLAELPVPTATSLAIESGGGPVDRTAVLAHVLRSLFRHYTEWIADPDALRPAYAAASVTLGRRVRAELPDGREVIGTAVAIDETGRVVIDTPQGPLAVGAGDVVHLRPHAG